MVVRTDIYVRLSSRLIPFPVIWFVRFGNVDIVNELDIFTYYYF